MTPRSTTLFLVCIGILGHCVGCQQHSVEGRITQGEQPVAFGTIHFRPINNDSQSPFAATIQEGNYRVEKEEIAGKYQVTVEVNFVDRRSAAEFYAEAGSDIATQRTKRQKRQYEFTRDLKAGRNQEDFDLSAVEAKVSTD